MSCKGPGEEIAHKITLAILNKLSSHSWEAKAVLTRAAFAVEYGDFWLLSQHQTNDPLAKSLATIKRVPLLTNPASLRKHQASILELNNLIKATLQVIEAMFELEKFTIYDLKHVPALALALQQFPVNVYWAIITISAIVTQIGSITTDSDQKQQELSQFGQKINIILNKLKKQISLCKQQIEEIEYYKILRKLFQTPTEITEVLKVLLFGKDIPQTPIYGAATKTLVNLEVLKKKDVFLFISTIDITEEEISVLKSIYEKEKSKNQYKILWVPIVEEWNGQLRKKFEALVSKMSWYVLHHFAPIKGLKFITKEWKFKTKPTFVVLNPQGKILHPNAFHMIQVWGLDVFPFTQTIEVTRTQDASWIGSLVTSVNPQITTWNESGWALLTQGSNVVLTGHGSTILRAVTEFDKWRKQVVKKGFEISIRQHHETVVETIHRCSHLQVPMVPGKVPDTIECPDCQRTMAVLISYRCCHKESTQIALNGA
ncbi:hypothetical protein RJT34_16387 [Clitoria ternatea]|uniref:Protein SIEVE ELEMENT OCCLUSION B-like n=1 Tax=Clitoria ternatea TaxID=43366 RepID=A0AAN9J892_CLITE